MYYWKLRTISGRGVRALTLVELMTAMVVTVLIGGVISVLISSTAAGTSAQNDGRRSLVKMQGIKAQVEDLIVNSRCVLAVGTNYLVLWRGDIVGAATPVNGAVNLSELELLMVDESAKELKLYTTQFPASWSRAVVVSNDTTYPAVSAWYNVCMTMRSSGRGGTFMPQVLGSNVTKMAVSLDTPLPTSCTTAKMVSVVISFDDASRIERNIVAGAAIANQQSPW